MRFSLRGPGVCVGSGSCLVDSGSQLQTGDIMSDIKRR